MNKLRSIVLALVTLICVGSGTGFAQNSEQSPVSNNSFILDFNDPRPAVKDQFLKKIFIRDSTYTYAAGATEEDWILESKRILTYDSQGRRLSSIRSIRSDQKWKRDSKLHFTYTADERLNSQVLTLWDELTNSWVNSTEVKYYYNYAGLENELVTLIWDGNRWAMSQLTEKTYTYFNAIENEIRYVWNPSVNNWKPTERSIFAYDDEIVSEETHQLWNDTLGKWQNNYTKQYSYNEDDKLIMTTQSVWNENEAKFEASVSTFMEYNENGQLLTSEQIAADGITDENLTAQDVTYNTDGNLSEVVQSEWDPDSQEWLVSKKLEHYWSKFTIGNLDSRPSEISCTFANPYTIGLPWFCESLKTDVLYTVELYDQIGRIFYTGQFLGQHTFRISKHVPPGFYTAVIRGGLDVHTEKIIVRQ
jgi:hypothetical protein